MEGINGKRSDLYIFLVGAVKKIQSKMFAAEDVKRHLLKTNARLFKKYRKILTRLNVMLFEAVPKRELHSSWFWNRLTYKLYHAADYDVPQTRERAFIVGAREDIMPFAPPPSCEKYISVKEASGDLDPRPPDEAFSHI
ncbi:MAG: DNA cytosine methyltransferase [Treponema sp.]|jgi:DNA (cytosine-5)-methyltransferase 1|nr:DNA cytosine methyltransferase [Treponema sp.]